MTTWFLSYNAKDMQLMERLETVLRAKDASASVFFAPKSLRAGGFWQPQLSQEIGKATAFILLVGPSGIGPWQAVEYYEALDRRVRENLSVVVLLMEGQAAPGLPFLRQLQWVITNDPGSDRTLGRIMEAIAGGNEPPARLWQHTAPYRGLHAMTESDADFFFGRVRETVETLQLLATQPDKLAVLMGNSGVGKSSLAQAGVLAALMREDWPQGSTSVGPWPVTLKSSRNWCFLRLRPGTSPIRALAEQFVSMWQFNATDPVRAETLFDWTEKLIEGGVTLRDLMDATQARYRDELHMPEPPAFLLYIDQGEELFLRTESNEAARFSKVLAEGLRDPRLRATMSLRADFLGDLQGNETLYGSHCRVDVPPLRESQLKEVISKPAELLSARFETQRLADDIAHRTAEDSTKEAGSLPLLSYLLDDMWTAMVRRGDGVLRLPSEAIELGAVLVERANAFLAAHPEDEGKVRKIFTLRLAAVRDGEEPTRRRAPRHEFMDDEWRLVTELADHPNRLLATTTIDTGETYAEVAHEALFRRWETLREWIDSEREFVVWKGGLESALRAWRSAPPSEKNGALLMGHQLNLAKGWLGRRARDIPEPEQNFIELSLSRARRSRVLTRALIGILAFFVMIALGLSASRIEKPAKEIAYGLTQVHVVPSETVLSFEPRQSFRDCNHCPELVSVSAGEIDIVLYSQRRHVVIPKPFAVGQYEVTFDEWDACVGYGDCEGVSDSGFGRGRQPVINVSWDSAQRYVAWLSRVTGQRYSLLTSAEWEYAARGGRPTLYFWGDEVGSGRANCKACGSQFDFRPGPVGSFPPNEYGLFDTAGNVGEWVEDCIRDLPAGTNPQDCDAHFSRGGAWDSPPDDVQVSPPHRYGYPPTVGTVVTGIRVKRSLDL